jgi:hypothetical protein
MEVAGFDSFQIAHRLFLGAEGWIESGMKINSAVSLLTRFTNYVTSSPLTPRTPQHTIFFPLPITLMIF